MDKTCEDRILDHLKDRVEDFRVLNQVASFYDDDYDLDVHDKELAEHLGIEFATHRDNVADLNEQASDIIMEYPLAASRHEVIRVELSYGGPQDYLEVHVDEDKTIMQITYHFLDWWDGASRTLTGAEFEIVSEFVERLGLLEY